VDAAPNLTAVEGDKLANIHGALLNFYLLPRSQRLYESDHPQRIAALGSAYDSLRSAVGHHRLELQVVRDGLVCAWRQPVARCDWRRCWRSRARYGRPDSTNFLPAKG